MQEDKVQYVSGFSIASETQPSNGEGTSACNGCWNCLFFNFEDTEGYGICSKFDAIEHCGNCKCNLWKERIVGNTDKSITN